MVVKRVLAPLEAQRVVLRVYQTPRISSCVWRLQINSLIKKNAPQLSAFRRTVGGALQCGVLPAVAEHSQVSRSCDDTTWSDKGGLLHMNHSSLPGIGIVPLLLLPLCVSVMLPGQAAALDLSGLSDEAINLVASSGWLGPAIFVALYVAATVLLFPASVLTLAAGALFGPLAGTALVSLASTLGATAAFLVARYVARPWVEGKIQGFPRFKAVLKGVAANGPYVVFLLRLSPLVPFNLLNYALGLTPVGLAAYVAASWAGMLPGTFAYVYLGGAGKAAVDAATAGGPPDVTKLVLYGVGAAATVLATRAISTAAGKALQESGGDDAAAADPDTK